MTYLKGLRTWWRSQNGEIAPRIQNTAVNSAAIAPIPNRQKLSLVRDMVVPPHIPGTIINSNNKYYDMVGRVVKFFPGGASYTVYLTDYTQNIHLFDYNWEEYKRENKTWLGPWGQFTLQVTLWSDNAQHAMKLGVREGDILSMRNMRLKLCDYKETIDGSPIGGTYEGKLHDDKKFPGRPTFTKLNESEPNEYIKQLLQREREYNRRENQLKEKREAGYTEYSQPEDPTLSSPPDPAEDLGENLQIKCGKHATVTTPIGKILNLTPDNRKYQIVCKVVDFMPQDVERFCTLVDTDETPSSSSSSSQCSDQPLQETTAQKWVWRFALLVKGRDGEEMRIIVEGTNAEFLLRLDATE